LYDSQGGGKVSLYSYEANATELALIYVPINSVCSEVNISGGELEDINPWQPNGGTYCGIVLEEDNVTLNLFGGKVTQIEAIDGANVNILGGEVTRSAGIAVFAYNTHNIYPDFLKKEYCMSDGFNYSCGIIHGIYASSAQAYTEAQWQNLVPTNKQYYVGTTTKTHDQFIQSLRTNPTGEFRIVNGNYTPVIVNGIGLTDDNQADMLADGGSVKWNDATKTLSLDNASISSIVLNNPNSEDNEPWKIAVRGKSSISGSGITCSNAHLLIYGETNQDTLDVFGAGCRAINVTQQLLIGSGVYVDAWATSQYAISASELIMQSGALKAKAQTRAVECAIKYHDYAGLLPYTYLSGSATSASLELKQTEKMLNIWKELAKIPQFGQLKLI